MNEAMESVADLIESPTGSVPRPQAAQQPEEAEADETPVAEAPAEEQNSGEAAEPDATGDASEESHDHDEHAEEQEDDHDDEDDEDGAQAGAWPKSAVRRLKRERQKRRALEERVEALQAQLEKPDEPTSAQPGPTAVTTEEATLVKRIGELENAIEFIESNPDGATVDGKEWSAQDLRAERRRMERELRTAETTLVEERRTRAALAQRFEQATRERHPWMGDKANPVRAKVEEIIRRYPALRDIPESRFWIAAAFAFESDYIKRAKGNPSAPAATKPAPPPPRRPAPTPGRPTAAPQPVSGQRAPQASVTKRFLESGDPDAGRQLIESILEPA